MSAYDLILFKRAYHRYALQTEDKVHGICRGFFYAKVPQAQDLSGVEALFVL